MSDALDLVNLLRALAQDMTFGDEAMAAETCRLSADAIERLTAERDAAWEAGRDAAVKVADDYAERMWNALNKPRAELKSGIVPPCKAGAGESIAADIRALATSKPE